MTAHSEIIAAEPKTEAVARFFSAVNKGISYFRENPGEAVTYIASNLDYTAEDAKEWMKTVEFVDDVAKVDQITIVENTVVILKSAGVIEDEKITGKDFVYGIRSL